jgi:ATP-dependent Clp protease ATP-binding subunit ClpX
MGTRKSALNNLKRSKSKNLLEKKIRKYRKDNEKEKKRKFEEFLQKLAPKIPKEKPMKPKFDLKPNQIKDFLDQYVIGQDDAKKTLSVAAYNHYKRINSPESDVNIEKSNVIMIGESGTGKTHLIKTLSKVLNVPVCVVDATTLTQTGYVGEDVESILLRLVQAAKFDVKKAEHGIVYIDEIDKIAKRRGSSVQTLDVGGVGVQQALLKIIESSIVSVKVSKMEPPISVNTENILFICGGAFTGIKDIISNRLNVKQQLGFNVRASVATGPKFDDTNPLKFVSTQDLMEFGMISEMLGRLPLITYLDTLTVETLVNILTQPKNAIMKQYVKMFEMDNIKFTIEDEVVNLIANKAIEFKLGARGLRAICERVMRDLMYDLPTQNVSEYTLTAKYVEDKINLIYNGQEVEEKVKEEIN